MEIIKSKYFEVNKERNKWCWCMLVQHKATDEVEERVDVSVGECEFYLRCVCRCVHVCECEREWHTLPAITTRSIGQHCGSASLVIRQSYRC